MINLQKELLPLSLEQRNDQIDKEARLMRWRLQREAQALLPEEDRAMREDMVEDETVYRS